MAYTSFAARHGDEGMPLLFEEEDMLNQDWETPGRGTFSPEYLPSVPESSVGSDYAITIGSSGSE